jgi:hypothetical protein
MNTSADNTCTEISISQLATGITSMNLPFLFEASEIESRNSNGFDRWYSHYPRKASKAQAEKAYRQVLKTKKATAAELLAGVQRYAAERKVEDPKYTKYPATWLNAACWKDEPTSKPSDPILEALRGYCEER